MTINEIMKQTHETEKRRLLAYDTMEQYLCHIHAEVSEVYEEVKKGHTPKELFFDNVTGEESGVPTELADIIILTCQVAARYNVDLDSAIVRKLEYNEVRPR